MIVNHPRPKTNLSLKPPPTTPHGAIARVLNPLGLRQPMDYRLHSVKRFGKRTGVRVDTWNPEVDELLAQRVEWIERETDRLGFPFRVVVHRTRSGQANVTVSYRDAVS